MARNSSGYVCTLAVDDPRLPQILDSVRKGIKLHNLKRRIYEHENPEFIDFSWSGRHQVKKRAYVRVRGRLGKDNPNAHLYRQGGPLHRYSSQEVRVEHSKRVDIYVSDRHTYVPVK